MKKITDVAKIVSVIKAQKRENFNIKSVERFLIYRYSLLKIRFGYMILIVVRLLTYWFITHSAYYIFVNTLVTQLVVPNIMGLVKHNIYRVNCSKVN